VKNPWLKRLLDGVVTDPEIVPRLKRAPAAKVMHHAYLGGLLEHMVSLCGLSGRFILTQYPEAGSRPVADWRRCSMIWESLRN